MRKNETIAGAGNQNCEAAGPIRNIHNKRQVGSRYENLAAQYLADRGYKIRERNFRAGRSGEIDLIAETEEGTLVFFECKFRSGNAWGNPLEAVDRRKQRQICRIALFYLRKHGYGLEHPCRFDVIGIYGDESIKHIENAFEFQW